jgi:23S rRNA pseudouridine1911/1915/1917 synthase
MFAEKRKYKITADNQDRRADIVLSVLEKEISRQYFQKLFADKRVTVGGKTIKPSFRVSTGETLTVDYPPLVKMDIEPFDIPLDIVYEDRDLLVVNKPAGMVVHPAEHGQFMKNSLVNAVLAHVGDGLRGIGGILRPGIVHRLDKDTSGLIIVAKTDQAHKKLVEIFKKREIKKFYLALVYGNLTEDKGRIAASIGRHPVNRKKQSIEGINAREATTEFEVLERFKTHWGDFTLVKVALLTGRTHQIRVHFQSVRHALVGDKMYGNEKINQIFSEHFNLHRQFLHAYKISFLHPVSQKKIDLEAGLSEDLTTVLEKLKRL